MRWAFGVCRCSFRCRQKRNFKLLFSFRQPPRFLFRGDQLVEPSSPRPLRGAVFEAASAAREAHLTVSFLAVNPLRIFIFEVLATGRNQLLRSPFFNRRPLRRVRILLIGFRGSTPADNFFSRCICARRTALRVSLISWPPREFARAKPQLTTKFFWCAPRCLAHTANIKSAKREGAI